MMITMNMNLWKDLEDFREELISYLDERIELNNFNSSTDDFQIKINDLINRLLR